MSLSDHIQWQNIPLPSLASETNLTLAIGTVGQGEPIAVISAGVHGDEGPWGAWAIHQMLERIPLEKLNGTIRVVPVANPLAMQADLRNAPVDQLDLNRAFPGHPDGSYTERVADLIVQNALQDADYVIDLHGGGSWCVNAFVFEMENSEILSNAIDAPFVVRAPDRSVTLTGYAKSKGATVTAIEMGGRSQYEADWAHRIATSLIRALKAVGVIEDSIDIEEKNGDAIPLGNSKVLRPKMGGIFMPIVKADQVGKIVEEGTVLGHILDPVTHQIKETFTAPFPQTAIMLLRPTLCRIEGGAMTYVLAAPLLTDN